MEQAFRETYKKWKGIINLLPIEEKESYKWIESSQKSKEVLEKSKKVNHHSGSRR